MELTLQTLALATLLVCLVSVWLSKGSPTDASFRLARSRSRA